MHSIPDELNMRIKCNDTHLIQVTQDLDPSELTTITINGEDKIIDKCLLDCPQLHHLKMIIDSNHHNTQSNINTQNIDRNGIVQILNDYHDILHIAKRVDNFEYIYHYLGGSSDIHACKNLDRFCMSRIRDEQRSHDATKPCTNMYNIVDVVSSQILDTIHVFIHHRHNPVGTLISCQRRRRYSNFSPSLLKNIPSQHMKFTAAKRYFDFGCSFYYGKGESTDEHYIAVSPKYSSLREELTQNDIASISRHQFIKSYEKCLAHFNSRYVFKRFRSHKKTTFSCSHVLLYKCIAIMISYLVNSARHIDRKHSKITVQKIITLRKGILIIIISDIT
eukprot:318068_1